MDYLKGATTVNWKVNIEWETVIKGDVSEDGAKEFAVEEMREVLGDYPLSARKLRITVERQK